MQRNVMHGNEMLHSIVNVFQLVKVHLIILIVSVHQNNSKKWTMLREIISVLGKILISRMRELGLGVNDSSRLVVIFTLVFGVHLMVMGLKSKISVSTVLKTTPDYSVKPMVLRGLDYGSIISNSITRVYKTPI